MLCVHVNQTNEKHQLDCKYMGMCGWYTMQQDICYVPSYV